MLKMLKYNAADIFLICFFNKVVFVFKRPIVSLLNLIKILSKSWNYFFIFVSSFQISHEFF